MSAESTYPGLIELNWIKNPYNNTYDFQISIRSLKGPFITISSLSKNQNDK